MPVGLGLNTRSYSRVDTILSSLTEQKEREASYHASELRTRRGSVSLTVAVSEKGTIVSVDDVEGIEETN